VLAEPGPELLPVIQLSEVAIVPSQRALDPEQTLVHLVLPCGDPVENLGNPSSRSSISMMRAAL
jgi:hypothetical protein